MPSPIKPVHMLDAHDEIFSPEQLSSLSDMQSMLLGGANNVREAKKKVSSNLVEILGKIYECKDDVITAANKAINDSTQFSYRVPNSVTDNELLTVKAEGLVNGYGRVVSFTQAGNIAIRDHYLKETNQLFANRAKQKFVLPEKRKASEESKFKRVS